MRTGRRTRRPVPQFPCEFRLLRRSNADERFHALEVADVGRRGLDRRGGTLVELGVDLVDALRPDRAAATLGQGDEVLRPRVQGSANGLVLHEQPLDRLASRVAGDALADSHPNRLAGLEVDRHVEISGENRAGEYSNRLPAGKGAIRTCGRDRLSERWLD